MDLKYITIGQCLDLTYEGKQRRFTVTNVLHQKGSSETIGNVIDGVQSLSIKPCASLFIANWDTDVKIVDAEQIELKDSEVNLNIIKES